MKPELHIRDLWTRDGEVGRATYVTWGVSLTVVKFIVDSIAVTAITDGVVWTPWSYLLPGDVFGVGLAELQPGAAVPLLLLSVPFVFVGVNLTLRRLRSVGWRPAGVILFFVPLVNLLLFAALCAIPASSSSDGSAPARPIEWLPKSGDVAAVVAILIAGALGAVVALLSMDVLNVYG